jgi:hypothetical protein
LARIAANNEDILIVRAANKYSRIDLVPAIWTELRIATRAVAMADPIVELVKLLNEAEEASKERALLA